MWLLVNSYIKIISCDHASQEIEDSQGRVQAVQQSTVDLTDDSPLSQSPIIGGGDLDSPSSPYLGDEIEYPPIDLSDDVSNCMFSLGRCDCCNIQDELPSVRVSLVQHNAPPVSMK